MSFFGISIPGMRIAGGMIVAILGFQLLFPSSQPPSRELERETGYKADIAFTPLAMPGLAGAGTFAVIMSLSSQASGAPGFDRMIDFAAVLTAIVIVAVLCFVTLRAADRLNRLLGPTGMIALTRLMGFLMVCIGVQFVIDGLTAILRDPAFWSGLSQAVSSGLKSAPAAATLFRVPSTETMPCGRRSARSSRCRRSRTRCRAAPLGCACRPRTSSMGTVSSRRTRRA